MEHIIKRDGKVVAFDSNKIKIAITKAFESTKEVNYTEEEQEIIINKVIEKIIEVEANQVATVEMKQKSSSVTQGLNNHQQQATAQLNPSVSELA